MTIILSQITKAEELPVPRGFTEAPTDSQRCPVKQIDGSLAWVRTNTFSGIAGEPGPPLFEVQVVNPLNPIELNQLDPNNSARQIVVIRFVQGQPNSVNIYQWDHSPSTENPPYIMSGLNNAGQWVLVSGTIPNWLINSNGSTTIVNGGEITINANNNTLIDIAQTTVVFYENYSSIPTDDFVNVRTFPALIGVAPLNILAADYTVFGYDKDGTLYKTNSGFGSNQRRKICRLGFAYHPDDITPLVLSTGYLPQNNYAIGSTVQDIYSVLGPQNVNGNIFSPSGANLKISKTAGSTFAIGGNYGVDKSNPNFISDAQITDATFTYYSEINGAWLSVRNLTEIDPNNYSDGTALVLVGPLEFTIQKIFWNTLAGTVAIIYGDKTYPDYDTAISNINNLFNTPPEYTAVNYVYRTALVVQQGTTDLTAGLGTTVKFQNIDPRFSGSSQGSSATSTLQSSYNASTNGEIIISEAKGALILGATSNANTTLLELEDELNAKVFTVDRLGVITGANATSKAQGLMSSADKVALTALKQGWISYSNNAVITVAAANTAISFAADNGSFANSLLTKLNATTFRTDFAGFVKITYAVTFTASGNNSNFLVVVRKDGTDLTYGKTSDGGSANNIEASTSCTLIVACSIASQFSLSVTPVAGGNQVAQIGWLNMNMEALKVN